MDVSESELKAAIEGLHGGTATLAQSVPVTETFQGQPVWEGVVHVFDLAGNSKATLAYAWSSPIEGSEKRRFFAVLHMGAIASPVDGRDRRGTPSGQGGKMKHICATILVLALCSCATSETVYLKNAGGQTVKCGPYQGLGRNADILNRAKVRDCVSDYQRAGYERVPGPQGSN